MPLTRLIIKNYKSIKNCDISLEKLNVLIGENGSGKTTILDAINYFYKNLTYSAASDNVFDENNRYSNELKISLVYDFSQFVKISKSNSDVTPDFLEDKSGEKSRYAGYYKAIIAMASATKDMKLQIELSQVKGHTIRWNYSYEDRLILKSLFPIFYVDVRNLDITEWGYIWDVLAELGKVSNAERETIKAKINDDLLNESHEMSQKLNEIINVFNAAGVSVKPSTSKEFAKILTKTFFSGESIYQKGKRLNYYSAGTNSVKYIELLIKSIEAISKTKLKEPIVLFDEPEISLHTNYLDELAESFICVDSRLSLFISTHSPRLIKNIIASSESAAIYNIKLVDGYSHIYRMKKFSQYSPVSKYRVEDDHINSYFSRCILFVEGETELELFSNPYIKMLFPKFRSVDVFKAMSDTPILNIMNPQLSKSQTPYVCLIDIDKAISYDEKLNFFSLKKEYFPDNDKEKFRFRNKHELEAYLYYQRKRINEMQKKLRIHYCFPFYSCNDSNYNDFILSVREYLLRYNVFSFSTTVEGALINKNTIQFSLDFLQRQKKETEYNDFLTYFNRLSRNDQINLLRLVFNGKSDLLKSWRNIKRNLTQDMSDIELSIEKNIIGKKTSGWVSNYLDEFFKSIIPIDGTFSEKEARKFLEDENNLKKVQTAFKEKFPELYSLLENLCGIIQE